MDQYEAAEILSELSKVLATLLANVLYELNKYDPKAVYPIVSILEPYIETSSELDLDMPPISSTRITAKVTDRGRAEPKFDFE